MRLLNFLLLIFVFFRGYCQSVEEIKSMSSEYIWGEGKSDLIEEADKQALSTIISQISTHVTGGSSTNKNSKVINGSEIISEDFSTVVKTYSSASLNNTKRIVLQDEPDAHVFRYIKRSDVKMVFNQRRDKILQFVANAQKAEEKLQISDALRYYYWAALLLKSHPYGDQIKISTASGEKVVSGWLPMAINTIFSDLKVHVSDIEIDNGDKFITLGINYKNRPVSNADFSYFTGRDWSNVYSATDGVGVVELFGVAANTKKLKLKWEYVFKGEARIDRELEEVMKSVKRIPFRKSYIKIDLKVNSVVEKPESLSVTPNKSTKNVMMPLKNSLQYSKTLKKVLTELENKNHQNVESLFTKNGYDTYTKLLKFGNARLVDSKSVDYYRFGNEVIARSMIMTFNFKSNNKQFAENVNFYFNDKGKIDEISFGLNKLALESIVKRQKWDETDRMLLIRFLETYKTAYALKRINYLDNIFADDALIVTGRVVKVKPDKDNPYKNNRIIRYNKQTKKQYIRNLRNSFRYKEYVNLKFEESKIRKSGYKGDVYGINIKQNYYSSNYGDIGYLFLLVDLNNKKEPVIHVRTWQPDANLKGSVFNLSDF